MRNLYWINKIVELNHSKSFSDERISWAGKQIEVKEE